jgi:hypothetical protein
MNYWLLNTDDSEGPGKDADVRMKARSVIAAWGATYGAEGKLTRPEAGDRVFYFLDKTGIIAMATFDHTAPFQSNDIFHMQHEGEFSRKVVDLVRLTGKVITPAEVKVATGYSIPTRGAALKQIHDQKAIEYISSRFR